MLQIILNNSNNKKKRYKSIINKVDNNKSNNDNKRKDIKATCEKKTMYTPLNQPCSLKCAKNRRDFTATIFIVTAT